MKVIVLSYMYPRKGHPYLGSFVEGQVRSLEETPGTDIAVVSPVPWAPKLLWFRDKWRMHGAAERQTTRNGVKIYHSRYLVIPRVMPPFLEAVSMYLSVRRLIKKLMKTARNKSVIHAHRVLPEGLAAVLLKRELRASVVCTGHGSDLNIYPWRSRISRMVTRYVLKKADVLIVVSEKLREKVSAIGPVKDIRVVTNGVDLPRSAPQRAGYSKPVDGAVLRILFVGTLCAEKGIRELLGAFKELCRDYGNIELVMVGNNVMSEWISRFLKENGIEEKVVMPGAVSHDKIDFYYSQASIFALPSYSEGMPTVLFEAMANRVPVVISRVGGVEEVIRDGTNGLLVSPRDASDLSEKIRTLILNVDLRRAVAENAFQDVVVNYTWKHNAEKMHAIYRHLLNNS